MLVTIFDQISNENLFLTSKFALSERSRTLKHEKYGGQQYYVDKPVRKSKTILTTLMFFLSPGTLLTSPINRSRSQLFRTFFLASLRFLQRPKRPLLFFVNFRPSAKKFGKRKNKFEKRKKTILEAEKKIQKTQKII